MDMVLTIISLVLFFGMVAAWCVLPGTVEGMFGEETTDALAGTTAGQTIS